MPSTGEWMVLLVVGLLIFGRRLPEVGRSVARTMTHFRRGLQDFKQEMDKDEDLKEVRSTVKDFKKAIDAPRILANPGQLLDQLGKEPVSTPDPDAGADSEEQGIGDQGIGEQVIGEQGTEYRETEHQETALQEPASREPEGEDKP